MPVRFKVVRYNDLSVIHHAGSISGGRAVILVYPEHSVSIAIISNQGLAPLLIESTAQVIAEPFLLDQDKKRFDRIRLAGCFAYTWTSEGSVHDGNLCCNKGKDFIDLHPDLAPWAERLGSPLSETAVILPMLTSGQEAFIQVVSEAGAFGINVIIAEDDSLLGVVSGEGVRVSGQFRARKLAHHSN